MSDKLEQDERQLDRDFRLRLKKYELIETIFRELTRWSPLKYLSWIATAWFAFLSIKEMAGKDTFAHVFFGIWTEIGASKICTVAFSLAILALCWGYLERRLRYRVIRRSQEYPRELEGHLDPERSSSGLTPEGRTRPED